MARELFTLNPNLDRARLAETFARDGRLQVRDFLTGETAEEIYQILSRATPYGIGWQAGTDGPHAIEAPELHRAPVERQREINEATYQAAARGEYAFQYARFPILNAYLEKWNEGSPHDLLIEHINAAEFMSFIREVTGLPELIKADAQATLYRPGHFLTLHDDLGTANEQRRVAYVLNLTRRWQADWGGLLHFVNEDGEIVDSWLPQFNTLALFRVPIRHTVSYVAPFADEPRFAITGWFREV